MGDRCYMELTCATDDDARRINEALNATNYGGWVQDGRVLAAEEMNYAAGVDWNDSGDLPNSVAPFTGTHSAGHDYPEGCFACDGEGVFRYVQTQEGFPVVPVRDDGNPDESELQRVREFQKLRRRVVAALDEGAVL